MIIQNRIKATLSGKCPIKKFAFSTYTYEQYTFEKKDEVRRIINKTNTNAAINGMLESKHDHNVHESEENLPQYHFF